MLDTVRYFERIDGSDSELVAEHGDPGLISFSLFSNRKGLQMWDPKAEQWFDVPCGDRHLGVGVFWCGQKAVDMNGALNVGIHRVLREPKEANAKDTKTRITMWYEMIIAGQVQKEAI